jgi:hypothetical protein
MNRQGLHSHSLTSAFFSRLFSQSLGITLAMLFGLAFLTTGCGAFNPRPYQMQLDSMELISKDLEQSDDEDQPDPRYACPKDTNIRPDWDWSFDGAGHYRVCPSRTQYSDIMITGKTSISSRICVFPAEFIDEQNIFTIPNPALNGGPRYVCLNTTSGLGVYATFANVRYNAAFIVEGPLVDQMYDCLVQKTPGTCPRYSFGVFR